MAGPKKVTVPVVREMKRRGEKIAALTAYDATMAALLDEAGLDIILVGDSAAMVVAGYETTLPMTMEAMLYHTAAVRRGVKRALLVADMPFLSYQVTAEEAMRNAGRFFQEAGAEAVKVEGGKEVVDTVARLTAAGMPVLGHLGLTPQSIRKFGGYVLQGATQEEAERLVRDARLLEQAGAFAIVLEKIPVEVAKRITEAVSVPTIGIGAGPYCDGQILVTHDMLGLFEKFRPKFARRYAELGQLIRQACTGYVADVKAGTFPSLEESFQAGEE
ncbi:MAG: 3-methyl-2-oxobutanoate hydroxymethyltransferase [candidate division KSB1 bacterium]|nr:3-methyl-2-oxobutanoate hydroxymethyltransferase [candidate division KSB1 bacterium]MDZ7293960.1 3-methyl-2-oxobutanoate hydroxymethyltransferase [candidate division KSB1 bacterium]MDZ7385059.1 3-methyl-2-oxobutanoate hydroxymethyltransferase [candidate division KSB1 bacterium]MDZ7392597.1 3-methyl-2-oxobutanoate hydroxymethyltransferase [candidate division KSB1 bacterium]MDZ7413188.1 3-methyl-2-oxobutanoate hydroxymethyltransferase [candidate division KSB1 bacterium]